MVSSEPFTVATSANVRTPLPLFPAPDPPPRRRLPRSPDGFPAEVSVPLAPPRSLSVSVGLRAGGASAASSAVRLPPAAIPARVPSAVPLDDRDDLKKMGTLLHFGTLAADVERAASRRRSVGQVRFLRTRAVVTARIAVRHEHHRHPLLLNRDPIVVKEESDDDHHNPPPSTSKAPRRTTMGKTKRRRISKEDVDDSATQPRPAVRQRRRDGGIGERRGGEGCARSRA